MNKRNFRYECILRDKLGKKEMYIIEQIKEEQCSYCGKYGKDRCRMTIQDEKCINYIARNKK